MKYEDYAAIPAMNWSTLKKGAASMLHLQHAIESDDDGDTPARAVLRLNHAAVLEPSTLASDFAIWTGDRRSGKEWEAFKLLRSARQIVKADEMDAAKEVCAAVWRHNAARNLIDGALTEHVIEWTDVETGVACKARLDVYQPGKAIADLKGDATTDEFTFARRVGTHLYYAQLAWYQMGVEAMTGERVKCYLIPYEQKPPTDVAVFEVGEDWLEPGRELCRKLLREYVAARDTGLWPGRYSEVRPLPGPPKWINPEIVGDDYEVVE